MSVLVGYLFGCIQPSYLIGKWKKANIKSLGSKNAGASNVTVVFGWKYGIFVALIDILKPVISVLFIGLLFSQQIHGNFEHFLYYANGASVILGHNFPFYMQFKGGKGTASVIGLFFVINWKFALIGLLLFVLLTILTNYIVIGAMALYSVFSLSTYLLDYGIYALMTAGFLTILAVIIHRDNFIRIKNGEETGLRDAFHKERKLV
ncbi:glycerol-3-phosphate acyltransferase [Salinibacillus xinjiangensis]|uniref:glycerol-3-phosphate acyltransferase n=1 Tax=Salinibacillus xinjiangensis TaxID=1229268 RepID=UPI002B26A1C2|nr:glycerol-3-phosphate acyltransferase [Salinibacillus xinjiangensis]